MCGKLLTIRPNPLEKPTPVRYILAVHTTRRGCLETLISQRFSRFLGPWQRIPPSPPISVCPARYPHVDQGRFGANRRALHSRLPWQERYCLAARNRRALFARRVIQFDCAVRARQYGNTIESPEQVRALCARWRNFCRKRKFRPRESTDIGTGRQVANRNLDNTKEGKTAKEGRAPSQPRKFPVILRPEKLTIIGARTDRFAACRITTNGPVIRARPSGSK